MPQTFMKLWHSFKKDLKLASKSWYFYIEIGMAVIIIAILLVVVPEEFDNKTDEYIYMEDIPEVFENYLYSMMLEDDLDKKIETVELEINDSIVMGDLFESEDKRVYFIDDKEAVMKFAEDEREFSAIMYLDENNELAYKYYMQGYESERLKNLYLVFHNKKVDIDTLKEHTDNQVVHKMHEDYQALSDRENLIPVVLTFNGSLMGLFIIAAYVFLDKQEGVIKAYAVTASKVWQYLMSKVGVLIVVSCVTSLFVAMPIMGFQPNYLLLLIFVFASGFFAASLGLVVASYYEDVMQAFGVIYIFMIFLIIPNISYFTPSWEPSWIKVIPTYAMLESFKEIIIKNGDTGYVLMTSAAFLGVGILLFLFANYRFKKTLTV